MKELYFDNSATTPLCNSAKEAAVHAMDVFGNPSSLHSAGLAAEKIVNAARNEVLAALGSDKTKGRLVFCGSGSEANNLAILGAARAKTFRGTPEIIITDSEHVILSAIQTETIAARLDTGISEYDEPEEE